MKAFNCVEVFAGSRRSGKDARLKVGKWKPAQDEYMAD